ncbi:MAG: hypothetical protein LBR27_00715 [Bifidobacteriaceae bacterium]|jgi:hypothetical protein|nr:hypothetical protein [Bifidobacteriaceae bacterium]
MTDADYLMEPSGDFGICILAVALVFILFALLLAVVIVFFVSAFSRPTAADVAWLAGRPVADPAERAFYSDYLRRYRRYRMGGCSVGLILVLVTSRNVVVNLVKALFQTSNDHGPLNWELSINLSDALFLGVAGAIVGALAAETYRVGQKPGEPPAADLTARAPIAPAKVLWTARVATLAAIGCGLGYGLAGLGWLAAIYAAAGLVVVGLAELTERAIADRRRPVLSPRAMAADARIRAFAGRTVAWLELAIAVLAASWAATAFEATVPDAAVVAMVLVNLAALGVAIWAVTRARTKAPRAYRAAFVNPLPQPQVAA